MCRKRNSNRRNSRRDGTFIPENVADYNLEEIVQEVEKALSIILTLLITSLLKKSANKEPDPVIIEKKVLKSSTDQDCGYIDQEHKKGLGYMSEMTVDTNNGIIIGVDCYPANYRKSSIILKHVEKVKADIAIIIRRLIFGTCKQS